MAKREATANWAYYLGLLSVLPLCGHFLGPIAFYLGLRELLNQEPGTCNCTRLHAWTGVIAGGLFGGIWWGLSWLAYYWGGLPG